MLADSIENKVSVLQANSDQTISQRQSDSGPGGTSVDQESLRRRIRSIVDGVGHTRSSETYWRVAAVVDELNGVVEQAWSYIADGDARNALDILEVFTDEFVTSWQKLDTSGR